MSTFHKRFAKVATGFLQTAVVFDDMAYKYGDQNHVNALRKARERQSDRRYADVSDGGVDRADAQDLDTERLIGGFAEVGLLCSVVGVEREDGSARAAAIVERADIAIFDWQIGGDDGKFALGQLIRMTRQRRLRLAAIYTGEGTLGEIANRIEDIAVDGGNIWKTIAPGILRNGNCCVALYGKPYAPIAAEFSERVVDEEDLASKLIEDFATCVAGLLPAIVLMAFGAIRSNTYRVLESFDGGLDPAFLTHRACLETPEEAEIFVVRKIADELAAIMEDAVGIQRSATWDLIDAWLEEQVIEVNEKEKLRATVRHGANVAPEKAAVPIRKRWQLLTKMFLDDDGEAGTIDREFAWLSSHRLVVDGPRRLHLGTVAYEPSGQKYLVCVTPRCDSVRLSDRTRFLFLELKDRGGKWKIVVRNNEAAFLVKAIGREPLTRSFVPDNQQGIVLSRHDDTRGHYFVDCDGTEYEWLGELKAEFAQRLAHRYGDHLGRVPAEETEWLRGMERKG